MKNALRTVGMGLCSLFFVASTWANTTAESETSRAALLLAPTPVAQWTDFNTLTSGSYTLTLDTEGESEADKCVVNDDGSVTIGGAGISIPVCNAFSVLLDCELPDASGTLVSIKIDSYYAMLNWTGADSEQKLQQRWSGNNNDYGTSSAFTAKPQKIFLAYGKGAGTQTFADGTSVCNSIGLHSSTSNVSAIRIGAKDDTGANALAGVKIKGIYFYDSKMTYSPVEQTGAYTREVSDTTETWTVDETSTEWSPDVLEPSTGASVALRVSGTTARLALEGDGDISLAELNLEEGVDGESALLTVTGSRKMTSVATQVNVDSDFSGVSGDLSLGAVSVSKGKTLTIKDGGDYTSIAAVGAGDTLATVVQTAPLANSTISTVTDVKLVLEGPTGENATALSTIVVDSKGGAVEVKGKYANFYIKSSGTSTDVALTDATIAYRDWGLNVGSANYTVAGASVLTTPKFHLAQGADGRASSFTLADTASLTVTATTTTSQAQDTAVAFGHWNGNTTFTVQDSATFTANTVIDVGVYGSDHVIHLNGGVFSAPGIKLGNQMETERARSLTINLNGGTLALGDTGLAAYGTTYSMTAKVLTDSVLRANSETLPIAQPLIVNEGSTLTLAKADDVTASSMTSTQAFTLNGKVVINAGVTLVLEEALMIANNDSATLEVAEGATLVLTEASVASIAGLQSLNGTGTVVIDAAEASVDLSEVKALLKTFEGTVLLKGVGDYGVPLNYGVENGNKQVKATFVFEGGTHSFTYGCNGNEHLYATGRGDDDPLIVVQNGAHLNFIMRDLSGWDGDTQNPLAVIAVKNGTLTFVQDSAGNTGYFRERIVLSDGTTLTLDDGNASGYDNFFNVYGGQPAAYEDAQIALESGTATIEGDRILSKGEYGFGVAADATLTVAVKLTGGDNWKKVGPGTLKLTSGETDVSGTLTIAEGSVVVADGASLGSGAVEVTGSLEVNTSKNLSFGNVLTGTGSFIKSGTGTLILSNADGFTGTIEVKAGSLVILAEATVAVGTVLLPEATVTVAEGAQVLLGGVMAGQPFTVTVVEGKLTVAELTADDVTHEAVVRLSEIMPKGSESELDPNGLESGWVEVKNTSTTHWADLADYRFIRINRCKEVKEKGFGNFPSVMIPPGGTFVFYTSEVYPNGKGWVEDDEKVGLFGTKDMDKKGKPIAKFYDYGSNILVWPDKVNPKKHPFVRLYHAPEGKITAIQDTVVIPSDLPESSSLVVEDAGEGESTIRWYDPNPTPGATNHARIDANRLGPNVGPLYEFEWDDDFKKKYVESEFQFDDFSVPATVGTDYTVTLPINPVMAPTGVTANAKDAITSVKLIYRKGFGTDATMTTGEVAMTKEETVGEYNWGALYTATIPGSFFTEADKGHLIQWKVEITDASEKTWTSPSFKNKDDGYEWYGTIVDPGTYEGDGTEENAIANCMNSKVLPTWHMFADEDSVDQMDTDADDQTLENNARVAIYDWSTKTYYDYVRIDLRGNTSKNFTKKSHGLRFAKAHPITMEDKVRGGEIEEVRKSSLISEFGDPSWMRQMVAFWLFDKMGNKVPFDFPVRCNLNGAFYQLAFHSERFTDELIEDFYGLDKFGYGYKNVGTLKSGSGTSAGGIEKKTPDDGDEGDISVLENELRAYLQEYGAEIDNTEEKPALTAFVVKKFDLPAWLNYIASSKITHETDDVWANISAYYDSPTMRDDKVRGTGTWMPLAYDFNLSFGQYYYNDVAKHPAYLMADDDWFKSHPFYGGNHVRCYKQAEMTETCNEGNSAYEAIFQSEKFRRLYLRRLRTLMDQELGAPVDLTDATEEKIKAAQQAVPFMAKMLALAEEMRVDAALDQAKWPNDSTDNAIDAWQGGTRPENMDAGIQEIWNDYVVPRRIHLYETHSVKNTTKGVGYGRTLSAGIPEAQSPIATLAAGITVAYDATLSAAVIRNTNAETIDLSDWTLAGPVEMKLPAGTVLDMAINGEPGEVYVTLDRRQTIDALGEGVTNQVVVGNASEPDVPTASFSLTAPDKTVVFAMMPIAPVDPEKLPATAPADATGSVTIDVVTKGEEGAEPTTVETTGYTTEAAEKAIANAMSTVQVLTITKVEVAPVTQDGGVRVAADATEAQDFVDDAMAASELFTGVIDIVDDPDTEATTDKKAVIQHAFGIGHLMRKVSATEDVILFSAKVTNHHEEESNSAGFADTTRIELVCKRNNQTLTHGATPFTDDDYTAYKIPKKASEKWFKVPFANLTNTAEPANANAGETSAAAYHFEVKAVNTAVEE